MPLCPSGGLRLTGRVARRAYHAERGLATWTRAAPRVGSWTDFHSLRASHVTLLMRSRGSPRLMQALARHSTPRSR